MYHKRETGQSKEVFVLKGGVHVRRDKEGHVQARISVGDTLHITKKEAESFSDKWELEELPVTADDITVDDEEVDEDEESTTEGTGTITPSEPNTESKLTALSGLDRQDFSSDNAHQKWVDADYPDLSKIQRTGHSGHTYSVKDVKDAV